MRQWGGSQRSRRSTRPQQEQEECVGVQRVQIELVRERSDEIFGLDIGEIEFENGQMVPDALVRGVIPGSPASRSNIAVYDKLLEVCGLPVSGSFERAVTALRSTRELNCFLVIERKVPISQTVKAWSATEEFMIHVNRRLYCLRGNQLEKLHRLAQHGLGSCLDILNIRPKYLRCWDVSTNKSDDAHIQMLLAVFGNKVEPDARASAAYREPLACVDGRVPGVLEMTSLGAAIGAWLSLDERNCALITDSSGAKLRAAFAAVAAVRVGGLLCDDLGRILDDERLADSALEAYDAYLHSANLKSALPLESLPPSFKRALSHLDAAIACRFAPNPRPLRFLSIKCTGAFRSLLPLFSSIHKRTPDETQRFKFFQDISSSDTCLIANPMVDVDDDFVVAISTQSGDSVVRFASNAAFLGAGSVALPRKALDVFPKYRESNQLPPNFSIVLELAHVCDDGRVYPPDAGSPPPMKSEPKVLLPADNQALLAWGRDLLSSSGDTRRQTENKAGEAPWFWGFGNGSNRTRTADVDAPPSLHAI